MISLFLAVAALLTAGLSCAAADSPIALTDAELAYVQDNPTVSIAIDTSWAPYGFRGADGDCAGIIPNAIRLAAERVGLTVRLVPADTYADAISACRSGETMLVSGIANDPAMAAANDVLITAPYINIAYSAITKNEISGLYEQGANFRVALCVGTYAKQIMQKKMPDYVFVEYHSNRECMDAVQNGEVDVALVATYCAEYFNGWHEYSKLQEIAINDFSWELCFGMNRDCDPRLISVLNKGIASFSDNDLNQAIYTGATAASAASHRFSDVFYERPGLTAALVGGAVALLALLLYLLLTQRKKGFELARETARQALQESEELLKAAMASAKMTVWRYDPVTHSVTQSQASINQHGFGPIVEDVPEGLIQSGFVHPDSAAAYRAIFNALPSATQPLHGDFLVQTPDRSGYGWERMILTPVWENGAVTKAIGTTATLTYQKEREDQYLKLVDAMTAADSGELLAKGRYNLNQNKILYYHRRAGGSLTLDQDATFDSALEQMAHTAALPADGDALRALLNRETLARDYAVGHLSGSFSYKRIQERGPAFWSRLDYTLFEEPTSGDLIFFVYTYDITERMREEKMLEKLGATEYDILGLIDVKTHQFESKNIKGVKSLADAGNHYLSGPFEDVVRAQILSNARESEREELEKKQAVETAVEMLAQAEVYTFQFSAIRAGQTCRRKQISFTYLDKSKTTLFYYCTDVTETYDREQAQLRQTEAALAAAREASAAKTEFFSRMSHDMRTPMNGILGLAALAGDESDPAVLKETIEKISVSGEYLLGLINDTLDFQRIESGKLQLEPQIVRGGDILESVLDMVRPTAGNRQITLTVQNQNVALDQFVRADPIRLKQIFMNLISNAVKFTPNGGEITLGLETLPTDDATLRNRFTIRDTGVGMSEAFLRNKIFQPFEQERNAVSGQYAGSGLGLSIVKSLVDLMGGTIAVESELGVGTTFIICIDFEQVKREEAAEAAAHAATSQDELSKRLDGRSILLAEDHPLNAEIAVKLLRRAGCTVTWAKDGLECVQAFQAGPARFDAILMDIRMPVMNGLEAAAAIRALPFKHAKCVPILAMTANAYEEDVEKSLAAGMNAHLAKPIDAALLYQTLAAALRESGDASLAEQQRS